MVDYLKATKREDIANYTKRFAHNLKADEGAEYDQIVDINLSEPEPHISGPFTPDLATPISKFAEVAKKKDWLEEIKAGLIGSCTNSSYEDMSKLCVHRQTSCWAQYQSQEQIHKLPLVRVRFALLLHEMVESKLSRVLVELCSLTFAALALVNGIAKKSR